LLNRGQGIGDPELGDSHLRGRTSKGVFGGHLVSILAKDDSDGRRIMSSKLLDN